ncbi:MAG TPA: DUF2127 domain-containing protein [Methylomirabilota bacterium]
MIRLVGGYHLVRGLALLAVGWATIQLAEDRDGRWLTFWLSYLLQFPAPHWTEVALGGLGLQLPPPRQLAAATLCSASLSLVEGIGLLMVKRWAMWLTLIVTAALLPLQIYELTDRVWWLRLVFLAVNLIIVYVLFVRLRGDRREG